MPIWEQTSPTRHKTPEVRLDLQGFFFANSPNCYVKLAEGGIPPSVASGEALMIELGLI